MTNTARSERFRLSASERAISGDSARNSNLICRSALTLCLQIHRAPRCRLMEQEACAATSILLFARQLANMYQLWMNVTLTCSDGSWHIMRALSGTLKNQSRRCSAVQLSGNSLGEGLEKVGYALVLALASCGSICINQLLIYNLKASSRTSWRQIESQKCKS